MSISKKTVGVTVAAAAAALFIAGVSMVPAKADNKAGVKCMGANSCKGHGECKTASNACNGMNACKGHGWVTVKTAKECTDMGGSVTK